MANYTYIYALVCPKTRKIRYIGKSNHPMLRFQEHLEDDNNTAKTRWLRELAIDGTVPALTILERCDRLLWRERERKWIAVGRALHWPLTNGTDGGDGPTDAHTQRRARAILVALVKRRRQRGSANNTRY